MTVFRTCSTFFPKRRVKHAFEFLWPDGAWWLRERVVDKVPVLTGHQLVHAEAVGDRVRVGCQTREGLVSEKRITSLPGRELVGVAGTVIASGPALRSRG